MADPRLAPFVAAAALTMACTQSDPFGTSSGAPDAALGAPSGSSSGLLQPPEKPPLDPSQSGPQGLLFDSSGRLVVPDAGPPLPTPLKVDGPVAADIMGREDLAGVVLEAAFKPRRTAPAPKAPEVAADGIAKAAKLTAMTLNVELTTEGRMKLTMTSRALPFPFRSEVRSRYDRYGHFVVWPGATKTRIIAPGALRAALGEGRVDVTPLSPGNKGPSGTGKRLGEKTRLFTIEAPLGKLRVEVASLPEASLGGPLLCRWLVESMGIDPASPECRADEVPLFAGFDWDNGDGVDFEVTSITKRTDIPPGDALTPPPGAELQQTGLPEAPEGIFLSREELAAFRTKAIDTKPDAKPGAPGEGLVVENTRDVLLYYFVDGVPVAAVPAQSSRYLIGLPKGRYVGQWRSFFGDLVDPAETFDTPTKVSNARTVPGADAGPP